MLLSIVCSRQHEEIGDRAAAIEGLDLALEVLEVPENRRALERELHGADSGVTVDMLEFAAHRLRHSCAC